jgi:uncharacterized SAM-binding protein YcdF (DUF218 family)
VKARSRSARVRARWAWAGWTGAALGLLAGAWCAGFLWFVAQIPDSVDDPVTQTDGVVVLTGAAGRLGEGIELIKAGKAKELFVSGVYRGVDVTRLLDASRSNPHDVACCIVLGHTADDTEGNAYETAAWVRQRGFASLRVVTSSYHLPRSLLELRHTLPDVTLVPHPVFAESFKRAQWWAWPGTSYLIASEFSKYLLVYLRHRAEDVLA